MGGCRQPEERSSNQYGTDRRIPNTAQPGLLIEDLTNQRIIDFIQDHLRDDPDLLMLNKSRHPGIPVRYTALQISLRQKCKSKLPFVARYPAFSFPSRLSYEQCSSEITAQYKASLYEGSSFADLTGGLGIDCCFMADRFTQASYVETDPGIVETARHNFKILDKRNIRVIHSTTEDFLERNPGGFDLVYIDPARRDASKKKVFFIEDCEPDIKKISHSLFSAGSRVLWKAAPLLDIKKTLREIPEIFRVDVISFENEVKELLFHMKKEAVTEAEIRAVDLDTGQQLAFFYSDENALEPELGLPSVYLYEPNAAIMKAGAFKSVGSSFGLAKLHPNTHLYSGKKLVDDFPGRKFRILEIVKPRKNSIKTVIPEMKANLSCRNFPMSVSDLRKKTGLREGGQLYVFATQDIREQKILLVTEKI